MGIMAALGGAQIIGGLLGRGHNPYSGQSTADLSAGRGYLGQLAGIGGQYGQAAAQQMGDYGADNGAYRSALGNEEQHLQTNPYTQAYGASQVANAAGSTTQAFNAARAHLTASLAARGMGQSGSMAGALSGLDSREAGAQAGLQNGLAQQAVANQGQRMAALTGLTGGAAGQDYARGMGALGAQGGIDSGLGNSYLGLGQQEQNLGLEYQGAQNSMIGSGASMLGQAAYWQHPMSNPYASMSTGMGGTGGMGAGGFDFMNPYGGF